jgi:HEAT repeat protein
MHFHISSKEAIAPLVSALKDKASEVRFNAALSVINIIKKSKLDHILYNKGNSFCGYKIWNAEFVFDKKELNKALEYLIIMLKKDDAKLRSTAATLLGEIENELVLEDLIKALEDSEESVRLEAAKALGMLKSSRAFEPLLKALKCESNSIKMAVVEALGKLEDNRSIEPLMNIIKNDHSKDVRARAVDALRAYRCDNIYDILAEALQDVDAIVRKSAADVMGLLAEPKAVAPLAVALIDKNVKVRHKAALALGDIGGVQAAGILLEAKMTEKNKYVLRGINEALGIIKDLCVVDFRTKKKY